MRIYLNFVTTLRDLTPTLGYNEFAGLYKKQNGTA